MGADRRPYSIMPVPFFSQVASSVRKRFIDTFSARSNTTGSLGIATDGSLWNAVNGTVQVTTGAATSTTTPTAGSAGTQYPMATITLPTQNNSVSLADTNEGSAVALWVQSSSDWWLVSVEGTQTVTTNYASAQNYNYVFAQNTTFASSTSFTQSTNFFSSSSQNSFTSGTTFNSGFRTTGSPFAFQRFWASSPGGTFWAWSTNFFGSSSNFSQSGFSSTAGSFYSYASAGTFYTYASGSTTAYSEFLRVRQSVASVVSIVTSQLISTAASIKSLLVSTSGNQITARGFSDNNFVTQIGTDLVYTATGATLNTQYGIAVSPSAYNQSAIIGTSVKTARN